MANLYARVATYDLYVEIDSVSGLANDRVFIFHGTQDSVVNPGQFLKSVLSYSTRPIRSN